ncbi:MAG: biopolymer transporter ExbD [Bacteroidetes bacterium]|nr:biopolymer transporter ExbD [Bacteroidota bacterium]
MQIKPSQTVKATFQMWSMMDLIFILLMFFMLISTLIIPNVNALKLLLPNSSTAAKQENIKVSVAINENRDYFINDQPVPAEQMETVLSSFLRDKVNPIVILHTHKSVPIENVVKVLDVANRLKVKLVLATNPER